MKISIVPLFATILFALAGCTEKAPPVVVDAGTVAAPVDARVVDAAPVSASATGVGKDTTPIELTEFKCAAPSKKGGVRVCGQTLVTRVAPNGDLQGFASSLDGMTLFGLKKLPAHRDELVSLGAPGQGAVLAQTESDDSGRFDVEVKTAHAAFAICAGRVLQTSDACRLIAPKLETVAVTVVANGPQLTWGALPDKALVLLHYPSDAK